MTREEQAQKEPRPPRVGFAIAGLLVVCGALAIGLLATAYLNDRAAQRAADAVLRGRAQEAGETFRVTARTLRARRDPTRLQEVAEAAAGQRVGIVVVNALDGHVAASAPTKVAGPIAIDAALRRSLRGAGHAYQRLPNGDLVYWRPFAVGVGGWRRWRRYLRNLPGGAAADWRPTSGLHLLRVTVSGDLASQLTAPARTTLALAGAASLLLLLTALGLHRGALRAQRADRELRRREALSSLGEMAAVLAHEIRTPLAAMKGNAQLLGEKTPDDDRVQAIVSEAGRLERLVNGMLDYARPGDPARAPVDPDALAERAAEIVAMRAAELEIGLLTDPADAGVCLQADADKLLQVLVNLLQNAVESAAEAKATEPVVLRVRRGRGRVSFTVLDRGVGLSEGVDQLVRPFYSTKRQGTGLGLSVAKQVVEQHEGGLELVPRKGGGVEARAWLPASASDGKTSPGQ